MKTITKYLIQFACAAAVLTLLFRFALSYGIDHQSTSITITSAIIYAVSLFGAGWYFGRRDGKYLPIFDVGFRFHFTTYLLHNTISILWIYGGFGSKYEKLEWTIMIAIYWGAFLLIHFIYYLWTRKKAINHLDKEDLFE